MSYLAWPACVLVIAITAIFVFSKPLERLLDRTKKISVSKSSLDTTATAQGTSIERKPSRAEELLSPFENALLLEQEAAIRQDLSNRRIDDSAEREKVLIRHLAAAYIYNRFDYTYQWIFGSQVSALQHLNVVGTASKNDLEGMYTIATITDPGFYANYSFDQWINFMVYFLLMRVDGDKVGITIAGTEFLKFLVDGGRPFNKAG
jgi:hypothetical protein